MGIWINPLYGISGPDVRRTWFPSTFIFMCLSAREWWDIPVPHRCLGFLGVLRAGGSDYTWGFENRRNRSDPHCFRHPWHLGSDSPCRNDSGGIGTIANRHMARCGGRAPYVLSLVVWEFQRLFEKWPWAVGWVEERNPAFTSRPGLLKFRPSDPADRLKINGLVFRQPLRLFPLYSISNREDPFGERSNDHRK